MNQARFIVYQNKNLIVGVLRWQRKRRFGALPTDNFVIDFQNHENKWQMIQSTFLLLFQQAEHKKHNGRQIFPVLSVDVYEKLLHNFHKTKSIHCPGYLIENYAC